ncbi:MAG TPA: AAA family ATPase [Pirellulaceae bacterium]|nr:AAA family ATPase [Pirellulaceae bacterium]
MFTSSTLGLGRDLYNAIFSDEVFWPSEPRSIIDLGLPPTLTEALLLKRLLVTGQCSGRQLATDLCLPFSILDGVFLDLRSRQLIVHRGAAPFNDYFYALTDQGRDRATAYMQACAYTGPMPVPISDYQLSVEAQTIRAEQPKRDNLKRAFRDITIDTNLFENLGPAINSGAGMFLYGEPGNGKSTLARRVTQCFGQHIWIPHALYEDGQIIKVYDGAVHQAVESEGAEAGGQTDHDCRWIRIRRPTVVVGGELTMDALEIRFDPISKISEAPLQVKSNCGCLLIDDFGRQRIEPHELLNRWIIPLEMRCDFLTLSTGKKIPLPFEQLVIFSTNLEPADLVDEAFLRRIPYKIEIGNPTAEEFHRLFQLYCEQFECEYRPDIIQAVIQEHYIRSGRSMRRCHPRDLLQQIRAYCAYHERPLELHKEYFDIVAKNYFTDVLMDRRPKSKNGSATGPSKTCGRTISLQNQAAPE